MTSICRTRTSTSIVYFDLTETMFLQSHPQPSPQVQRPSFGELAAACLLQSQSTRHGGELLSLAVSMLQQWCAFVYSTIHTTSGGGLLSHFSGARDIVRHRDACSSGKFDWALQRLYEDSRELAVQT